MRPIGVFDTLGGCQAAVNKTSPPPRGYTYQSKDPTLGAYAGHCYALSAFGPFDLHPQKGVVIKVITNLGGSADGVQNRASCLRSPPLA